MRAPLLAVSAAAVLGSSCSSYIVQIHAAETDRNHYVLLKIKPGGTDHVYDCYSKPDGQSWSPTCREVTVKDSD